MRWCTRCKRWLPVDMFSLDRSQSHGYNCRCAECDIRYGQIKRAKRKLKKLKEKIQEASAST